MDVILALAQLLTLVVLPVLAIAAVWLAARFVRGMGRR